MFKCKHGTILYGNKCLNCEGDCNRKPWPKSIDVTMTPKTDRDAEYIRKLMYGDPLEGLKFQGVRIEAKPDSFFENLTELTGKEGNVVYHKTDNVFYVTEDIYKKLKGCGGLANAGGV